MSYAVTPTRARALLAAVRNCPHDASVLKFTLDSPQEVFVGEDEYYEDK